MTHRARQNVTHHMYVGGSAQAAAAAAADAARNGAHATMSMAAAAGRASYVSEASLADNADPGAVAVSLWLEAVSRALQKYS